MKNQTNFFDSNIIFRWVLTAAHCLNEGGDIVAHFGIDSNGHFYGSAQIPLANYFSHPEYNTESLNNDIGLYILFSPYIYLNSNY